MLETMSSSETKWQFSHRINGLGLFEMARCKHELQSVEARRLGTMKEELITSYSERMGQYIGNHAYMLSSLLDINIKGCVFTAEAKCVSYELLVETIDNSWTYTEK